MILTDDMRAEMRKAAWAIAPINGTHVLALLDERDRLERELAAERERTRALEEALEPFADDFYHEKRPDSEELTVYRGPRGPYTIGDFRRAARVLAGRLKTKEDDRAVTGHDGLTPDAPEGSAG